MPVQTHTLNHPYSVAAIVYHRENCRLWARPEDRKCPPKSEPVHMRVHVICYVIGNDTKQVLGSGSCIIFTTTRKR